MWVSLGDAVVVAHVGFVAFVLLGGLLVLRWWWIRWVHVPAALWAALVEYADWICPLTPLENHLRERGGASGYSGDFFAHYVLPLLYPEQLTRTTQIELGTLVLAVNVAVYAIALRRRR